MLNVENVTVYRAGIKVLHSVSFNVNEGEVFAVLGANGAGKTTLLETILGLHELSEGKIEYMGEDISRLKPHQRVAKGIALVPEGRQLFPKLTVLENLYMGAYTLRNKIKLEESLERVYKLFPILKERAKQKAGTLSGGEQQMLAIARALITSPKLIMLDEPSTGLAPKLVIQIFNSLKKLIEEEKITVILVEQHVAEALKIANRAIVLESGRVVLEGNTESLKENEMIKKAYLGM